MSQRDKWAPRPCVIRYRAFCDELRLRGARLPDAYRLVFELAMPPSWPKSKRDEMRGTPHQQKPDASNLAKAVEDALEPRDEKLHNIGSIKRWADHDRITIIAVHEDHDLPIHMT